MKMKKIKWEEKNFPKIEKLINKVEKRARTNFFDFRTLKEEIEKLKNFVDKYTKFKVEKNVEVAIDFNSGRCAKSYNNGYSRPQTTQVFVEMKKGVIYITEIARIDQQPNTFYFISMDDRIKRNIIKYATEHI